MPLTQSTLFFRPRSKCVPTPVRSNGETLNGRITMNLTPLRPRLVHAVSLFSAIATLTASAQSGSWTNIAPAGNWSDPLNWLNGIVASGPGAVAGFNTIDLTNAITVTIDDFSRTNGHIVFSDTDTNTAFSWTLAGVGLTAPTNLTVTVSNLGPNQ